MKKSLKTVFLVTKIKPITKDLPDLPDLPDIFGPIKKIQVGDWELGNYCDEQLTKFLN